jgi:hypothetical protein
VLQYSLLARCTSLKGDTATHNNQHAVDKVVDIFSRQKDAGDRVEPSGSPYKRPPKNISKSTSARGRPVEEDAGLILAYSKERFECPRKCWEGYDPGMDAGF